MVESSNPDEPEKEKNWKDAEHFRTRSDSSANYLRTLLFALTIGAIGYVAEQQGNEGKFLHLVSMIFFVLAIFLLWKGWVIQKRKSLARQKKIEESGLKGFVKYIAPAGENKNENTKGIPAILKCILAILKNIWHELILCKDYSNDGSDNGIRNETVDFAAAAFIAIGGLIEGFLLFLPKN
jgi:hypothetical protein